VDGATGVMCMQVVEAMDESVREGGQTADC